MKDKRCGVMARYIDADKIHQFVEDNFKGNVPYEWAWTLTAIDKEPTADVEEVKHAEWRSVVGDVIFACSNCDAEVSTSWDYENDDMFDYCPCCGAKMDGTPKERGTEK